MAKLLRVSFAVLVIAVAAASYARAQEVKGHFGFGPSFPQGNANDFLDSGWAIHGGATWYGKRSIGLRLDVGYDWFDIKDSVLDTIDTDPSTPVAIEPPDNGDANTWSGTLNLFWESKNAGHVRFYLTGGAGVYYNKWNISQDGYAAGYWCDWYWGICYPGVVPAEFLIQSGSSWDWGVNAGVGIAFPTHSGEIYVEADYHWIDSENSAQMVPVTIGYRW